MSDAYRRERIEMVAFRAAYGLLAFLMVLPLLIVISTSFGRTGQLVFPPKGLSLQWYAEFLSEPSWMNAMVNSLITASGTAILSTFLGVTAAFGLRGVESKWIQYFIPIALLPLLLPAVVIAVIMLMYLSQFGLQRSYVAIVFAHSLWATPLVFFIMQAVLSQFDWELKDAANDLGAGPIRSFGEVILPNVKNGILASALIAFIISLQEFVMALFLSGQGTRTIPVLAWIALRNVLDPVISVVSTLLIVAALLLVIPAALAIGLERLAKQL
ncbi:ABC transporter permease [Halobium palmae]|uniref:ABC transporter permease n=1 Tax=Halobium palmae TaxID=1776492 RepID=A0ABD5RX97_9EURY